jgi:hypothetical protein
MSFLVAVVAVLAVLTVLNLLLSSAIIRLLNEQRRPVTPALPAVGTEIGSFEVTEVERRPQRAGRVRGVRGRARRDQQPPHVIDVDETVQQVPARHGDHGSGRARPVERATELGHLDVHLGPRGGRRQLAPQGVDQPLHRDRLPAGERQRGEHRAPQPPPDRYRFPIDPRADRTEDRGFQQSRIRTFQDR